MVTLQKRFTNGPNPILVRGQEAQKSIHSINNKEFYHSIENYVGWTIIEVDFNQDIDRMVINDLVVASCVWLEGFCDTCFDYVQDIFDFTNSILVNLIGKTICAVGLIDDPEIVYYQNMVQKMQEAKLHQIQKVAIEAAQDAQQKTLQPVSC